MNNQTPPEMTLREVNLVLSQTIKQDEMNKSLLFLGMLSAFTEDGQINIFLNAPSSAGKTYLTQEIAKLFPEEDTLLFSNATPTALFYGKSQVDEESGARIVDLERKILIFLEQPDSTLQANLRSVLSHDRKELIYQRTNRNRQGANRTEEIIIRGYPSTVFCSALHRFDEQEATRAFILSPEISASKIESAIDGILLKNSDPEAFHRIENDPARIALKRRIGLIRDLHIDSVIIPNPGLIKERLWQFIGGSSKPRYMRDVEHLVQLIKSIALLNIWYREKNGLYYANESDVDEAFRLWGGIMKTQALNITPYLYDIYQNSILKAYKELPEDEQGFGLSRQDLIKYHLARTQTLLSDSGLRQNILPALQNAGLISLIPSYIDHRQLVIMPCEEIEMEGCSG